MPGYYRVQWFHSHLRFSQGSLVTDSSAGLPRGVRDRAQGDSQVQRNGFGQECTGGHSPCYWERSSFSAGSLRKQVIYGILPFRQASADTPFVSALAKRRKTPLEDEQHGNKTVT